MSLIEIFLIAVSLCFDTLAVSVVQGTMVKDMSSSQRVSIEAVFGTVQGVFVFVGWFLGYACLDMISSYDHWIAFVLLLGIGGKMIAESFNDGEDKPKADLLRLSNLILAAVATSIDALAVGVSMAMTDGFGWKMIFKMFFIVGVVTACTAAVGLRGGRIVSRITGSRSGLVGGVILILIGIKILMEHLFV